MDIVATNKLEIDYENWGNQYISENPNFAFASSLYEARPQSVSVFDYNKNTHIGKPVSSEEYQEIETSSFSSEEANVSIVKFVDCNSTLTEETVSFKRSGQIYYNVNSSGLWTLTFSADKSRLMLSKYDHDFRVIDGVKEFVSEEYNKRSKKWRTLHNGSNRLFYGLYYVWTPSDEQDVLGEFLEFKLVRDYSKGASPIRAALLDANGNDISLQIDSLITVRGEESVLISDKNWNAWNFPLKRLVEEFEIDDDGEDPLSQFEDEIKDLVNFEDFEFKPLNDDLPIVATTNTYGASGNNKCYTIINFTYSDQYPTVKIYDESPSYEDHDVKFSVGNPTEQEGIKFVPVKVIYNRDFSDSANKYFDPSSFICIRATCKNKDDASDIKECFAYLVSSPLKSPTTITVNLNIDGISSTIKAQTNSYIDLPLEAGDGLGNIAYFKNSTYFYKSNYKTGSSNVTLNGYTWPKLFESESTHKFSKESNSNFSGLPFLSRDAFIYFDKTKSKFAKYVCEANKAFANLTVTPIIDPLPENTYAYIPVVKNDDEIDENFEKVITFGYSGDQKRTNVFHCIGFDGSDKILTCTNSTLEGAFFVPMSYAYLSKYKQGIIKILLGKSKNNKIIDYDQSYYDLNLYNSSILDIYEAKINVVSGYISLNLLRRCQEVGSTATVIFPKKVSITDKSQILRKLKSGTGVESRKYDTTEVLNQDFIGHTTLIESKNGANFWASEVYTVNITHNKDLRSITYTDPVESVVILSNVINNNKDITLTQSCTSCSAIENKVDGINGEDAVYFTVGDTNSLKKFNFSTLVFENVAGTSNVFYLFDYELYNTTEENSQFEAPLHKIAYLSKNGTTITINYIGEQTSKSITDADLGTIKFCKHVHVPGIYKESGSNNEKTDCCILLNCGSTQKLRMIRVSTFDFMGISNMFTGTNNKMFDSKLINGILFAGIYSGSTISTYNFDGVHPYF